MMITPIIFSLFGYCFGFTRIAILLWCKDRALISLWAQLFNRLCCCQFNSFLPFLPISLLLAPCIVICLGFIFLGGLKHIHGRCCFFMKSFYFRLSLLIICYDLTDDAINAAGMFNDLIFDNRINFNLHFLYPFMF